MRRDRVLQVLSNLVGNSIKFTPAGGSITVSARAAAGQVLFAVSDTGPGIAPALRPRIFERFWQAEETARKGQGLGLYIAKGLVEAQGGTISVDSADTGGTTFSFTLPIVERGVRADAASAPAAPASPAPTRTAPRSGGDGRPPPSRAPTSRPERRPRDAIYPGSGGGGGGGGGGTAGGLDVVGGGPVVVPGGCGIGGCGIVFGGSTHDVRSKNRNSSAFACGDIMLVLQPDGNGLLGSESSPPVRVADADSLMWMSVNTTFPHCIRLGRADRRVEAQVLARARFCESDGLLGR